MALTPPIQPLLACRSVVARVAFSEPPGWLYIAFCPQLVNVGTAPAHNVRLQLHPVSPAALAKAGCRTWPGEPRIVEPRVQEGEATVIALERELSRGLHVQHVTAGNLPADSWAIAIPEQRLAELPDGWLPIFETAETSVDLERPGRSECGMPSDLAYGICTYSYGPSPEPGAHDHFLALPFDRIYVPTGWSPPPALVDTDGN